MSRRLSFSNQLEMQSEVSCLTLSVILTYHRISKYTTTTVTVVGW